MLLYLCQEEKTIHRYVYGTQYNVSIPVHSVEFHQLLFPMGWRAYYYSFTEDTVYYFMHITLLSSVFTMHYKPSLTEVLLSNWPSTPSPTTIFPPHLLLSINFRQSYFFSLLVIPGQIPHWNDFTQYCLFCFWLVSPSILFYSCSHKWQTPSSFSCLHF